MSGRRTQARALGLVALILLVAAGCGGEPAYEDRRLGEIERALKGAGLTICGVDMTSQDDLVENAASQTTFFVYAGPCLYGDGADDEDVIVTVIAWPDQGARDEAIRRFEAQSRPSSQSHGVQLAYGQFTIDVSGSRDEQASDRAVDALVQLGAG